MLHYESQMFVKCNGKIGLFLVTIFRNSAKLPPPLQQFQWVCPRGQLARAKITEKKMEVGLGACYAALWGRCSG
jgi:hypothetical protein